ncbi:MAG: protein translocase subunit SecDF, partial [Dysgonamonadaceae bacterium]
MSNKGFIKVFSILLTLICLYYLSFTVVGWHYDKKANEYAKGNLALKNHYLDSLSTEKVYLGYTLKEVRQREIGLGLDLKGGMTVILEVDAAQVLRSLANTDDPFFNQALQETIAQNRKGSSLDFVSLFRQNYERINPNGKLANIFSITMSDRIKPTASNDEVIAVLRQEVASAADNAFNVLRTRIDRFGVVSPNIQKLDRAERILIELPGITEPERVRNLLQGRANLEFWKTYNVNELAPYFNELNQRSTELVNAMKEVADSLSQQQNDSIEKTASLQLTDTSVTPSLQLRSTDEEGEEKPIITKSFIEYFHQPYFAMSGATGPIVGTVAKNDTAAVNFLLNKFKDVFPADVQFRWGFKPVDVHETYFELYVLKGDGPRRGPALDGDVVVNARADQGQQGSGWEVSMTMNSAGASRWATITGAEKGKSIAIVLDGYVYSAPRVNDRIEGG